MALRLPDQSFAGPGLRSAIFLFTRPWLLVPGLAATVAWAAFLVTARKPGGPPIADVAPTLVGIALICGFGTAVLTTLPAFMVLRWLETSRDEFRTEAGEEVIRATPANHFLGAEGRGGRLHLTSRRIVFVPHRFNVQLDRREVLLDRITSVAYRYITTAGNASLSMTLEIVIGEDREVFAVAQADEWADLVESACR